MASSKGYGRRGSNRLADMSLPAGVRRKPKRKGKRAGGTPPAQMDHGNGSKADQLRRDGEKRLRRSL